MAHGRELRKMWRNGCGGKWTCRIKWYQRYYPEVRTDEPLEHAIRLEMVDVDRKHNYYPETLEEADKVWFMFKQGAPEQGVAAPVIMDLLDLLKKNR